MTFFDACTRTHAHIPTQNDQKYYLCCCRISLEELVGQQHDNDGPHAALNDFIFEVDEIDQAARVNMSGLTTIEPVDDNGEDNGMSPQPPQQQQQQPQSETNTQLLSIHSFFPDLLGGQDGWPNEEINNTLDEPLIRSTRRTNRNS